MDYGATRDRWARLEGDALRRAALRDPAGALREAAGWLDEATLRAAAEARPRTALHYCAELLDDVTRAECERRVNDKCRQ